MKLLHYTTEEEFLNGKINYNINKPKENKKDYLKIREKLENQCYEFVKETENKEMNTDDLPEIAQYQEFVKRSKFQKELLLDSYHKLNEMYLEEVKNAQNAWDNNNKGWENYEQLCKKIEERGIKI